MSLILNWQKKLGYFSDPFIDEPYYKKQVRGLDDAQERINLFLIKNETLGLIKAESGMGKTTLLKWLEDALKGKIKTIYLDIKTIPTKEALIKFLFKQRMNILEKIKGFDEKITVNKQEELLFERLKDHLLLIDNSGSLSKSQETFIIELNSRGIKLLMADIPSKVKANNPNMSLTIKGYDEQILTDILKLRIVSEGGEETYPFDKKEISKLINKSESNPRTFLSLARGRAIELSLKAEDRKPKKQKKVGFLKFKFVDEDSDDSKNDPGAVNNKSDNKKVQISKEMKKELKNIKKSVNNNVPLKNEDIEALMNELK